MKYRFEVLGAYPKRRFAVYEKKEGFWDRVRMILGMKKKKGKEKKEEIKQGMKEGKK